MEDVKISQELYQLLDGEHLENKQHEAMMLLTMDEDQFPHVAMISVGEIVALSLTDLRLSMWVNTTTTRNILRTKKATFVVFYNGKANYIRLSLERMPEQMNSKYPRERFSARVVSAREDVAKYADIISGVKINLKEPSEVISRWQETIEELL